MVLKREEIQAKDKWKLEDIFQTDKDWEIAFTDLSKKSDLITKFKGKLNDSESVVECLSLEDELSYELEKLYVYAMMRQDEDGANEKYSALVSKS